MDRDGIDRVEKWEHEYESFSLILVDESKLISTDPSTCLISMFLGTIMGDPKLRTMILEKWSGSMVPFEVLLILNLSS